MNKNKIEKTGQDGYSLIEMMVVLLLIGIVSVIVIGSRLMAPDEVGGAERVLQEAMTRLNERKSDAIRLNGAALNSGFDEFAVEPVLIDFADPGSTATLRISTDDADRNCADDYTNEPTTCLLVGGNQGYWRYAYERNPLVLPQQWRIATTAADLGDVPLIGGGTGGRGNLATAVGFDRVGHAFAVEPESKRGSGWRAFPDGSPNGNKMLPDRENSPFWGVYFILPASSGRGGSAEGFSPPIKAAVALAVHPASGMFEAFRWDGKRWRGYDDRTLQTIKGGGVIKGSEIEK